MILIDTSIWIDHLQSGNEGLIALLNSSQVLMHPFVLGELACGNLSQRTEILALLNDLPQASVAQNEEVLFVIEQHKLMGKGIGYVDAHLLSASLLNSNTRLWTRDKRLSTLANKLNIEYSPA